MIHISNLSVHFTGVYLFENVSFVVGDNDKIGLVGKNGAGKTTLLNILAKQLEPQGGTVVYTSGHKVGYLPQEMRISSAQTIWDETLTAFEEVRKVEQNIALLTQQIADSTDYESEAYAQKLNRLEELNRRAVYLGAGNMTSDTERVLMGLGFSRSDFSRPVTEFSSGWQMRVELAKILLRKTEIILLDEPTNHLDIESIQWLESFLQSYNGALIMVSHDRVFLDSVCKRTVEITCGHVEDYNCNYSTYVTRRAERIEHQKAVYENRQKERAEIEDFIERFRYKATKAKQVQSRVKMLEKMEVVQVDEVDTSKIRFLFPPAPKCDKVVFEAENLQKSYDNHQVLQGIDFAILKGEKVAFVGRNGEGKTTLVRMLQGELLPTAGKLSKGSMVKIGYFAQNHNQFLDFKKNVFQTIDDVAVGDMRTKVRGLLGSFLFSNDDMEKPVSVLSGGEKSRLVLAKLLLEPYNVLILDEPTNHLDMQSKDVLKNALLRYDGTLILVSHDRDFLAGLTDKVYEFKDGKIKEYLGDIQYFLDKKQSESAPASSFAGSQPQPETKTAVKISWEEQKQKESQIRKLSKQIEQTEAKITECEAELEHISACLANQEQYQKEIASGELYKQYETIQANLNTCMEEWERLSEEMMKL